jgi:cobalt-zinc-cadmium efflux system outer membrane protein
VVTAGKLRLGRSVAIREVAAAEQQREQIRLQLLTTTRVYYFEALAAERELSLARQLAAMGEQAMEASQLLLEAQEGSRASLLASQVEFESAALLVEQATNRKQAAWRRLASIMGMPDAARRPLDDTLSKPLPAIDWDSALDRLLRESPELAELWANVERAKCAVQEAKSGRVPNVTLMGGAQMDHETGDTIANAQVSMPLPLFNRNQGNVSRAYGELAAAQAAVEERELELAQRLADALRDYRTASRRVEKFTNTILPAAAESLALVNQAYEQGEVAYVQLLATQRTYTEKNLANLADLETAWKKWAEIDGLLVGTLANRNE